ncbi:hypothetical protein ACS0TY_023306 [Phlomoides rotata]
MLLTQSSFLCPPTKFSLGKCLKTNTPLLFTNNLEMKNRVSGKTAVLYNGYSYFTSPCHPLQLELPTIEVGPHDEDNNINQGIGILKFFEGKNILLTGATGLVGKVLVEKILRSTPVGKVYVLIKAKDKESAFDRLTTEVINSDLFKCLKEEHGNSYEAFVREKLIPIVGNICEPNIGMDSDSIEIVRKDVHVIIQAAASTTLNDRYDSLLDSNMNAPQRLMRFAKTCKNLKLFTHISTAYVNGRKEGTIYEKALIMGENGRKECDDELASFPPFDVADEINMILKACTSSTDHDSTKILKKLGQDRASFFGWYNSYHMTKAMGEMILNEIRGDVPLLIIRPAVIESSYKEPFPGWIQGNRMFDPVIISYGKGNLPAFLGKSEMVMDVIPVDMVVNTIIAAIAKEGSSYNSQLNVYHVGSSATNPLKFSDFFEYLFEYFNSSPLVESINIPKIEYFNKFDDFSKFVRQEIARHKPRCRVDDEKMIRRIECQCKAKVAYVEQLCKMYEFIGFFNARFDTSNSQKLIEEMSTEEQLSFEVDARNIEWRSYFQDIHIPGLRKHIINGNRTTCI